MRLRRLFLADYRNFERVELDLPPGLSLFVGDNAQGKSNLLEAVYLLATMRAARAETDVQLVRLEALDDGTAAGGLAGARIAGEAETRAGAVRIEVAVVARPGAAGPLATKTVKVNGVARRLSDAVGCLTAVLFSADDLQVITGPPSVRRRFMDTMLVQVDPAYARARSTYERVLEQRNHLLKRIREGEARPEELEFWDGELARNGGILVSARAAAVAELGGDAAELHGRLSGGERLRLAYRPRLEGAPESGHSAEEAEEVLRFCLARTVGRDVAAGMTLSGPHRDDLALEVNGRAASAYASRGQQRGVALALRLAEARLLARRRGEPPVLLLDDVLSEMDAARRRAVLAVIDEAEQVLATGTDWDRFPAEWARPAAAFEVAGGSVSPAASPAPVARTEGS